jgi:membrane protein required for colicin V production
MNWVDLAVVVVIAVSALLGLSRGLVREVLGLGAWILAGYGASIFGPAAVPIAQQMIGNPDISAPAAYAATFVVLLIVLSLLSNLVGRVVSGSALGGLDRSLGLIFGVVRGAVIVVAIYIPLALILPPEKWPQLALDSRTVPLIYDGAVFAAAQLPEAYRPRVPAPPGVKPTTAEDLLHATPEGRALGPVIQRP